MTIFESGIRDVKFLNEFSSLIIIGTVRQVEDARWTTPNGQRPANPHTHQPARDSIFTPVFVDIDRTLKGQWEERSILIYAPGGTVGQDSVRYGSDNYIFQSGEQVLLFLELVRFTNGNQLVYDGKPLWNLIARYTITADGQAVAVHRSLPLTELLEEIRSSINP